MLPPVFVRQSRLQDRRVYHERQDGSFVRFHSCVPQQLFQPFGLLLAHTGYTKSGERVLFALLESREK